MKIHVISETPFVMKATGVHTAFIDHLELLKEKDDIEVVVNDEGTGDIFHGHTLSMTRQMIIDKEFYNMGLKLSEQLITQFDKDIIRGKLIAVYQGLMSNFRTEMRLSTSVIN